MGAETFIDFLSSITSLSAAYKSALTANTLSETYYARQVIHAAGQTENRLWFIENGLLRVYHFDAAGREHTLGFYGGQTILYSYQGFWNESSDNYIEVLQDCKLVTLSYEQIKLHLKEFPEAILLRDFFLRQLENEERFRKNMLSWTSEERYLQIRKRRPELFAKVSVRLIATYLNMTRENLSRLMGKNL